MALHLVTGGSGFVGSNIVRLLLERNESVRVLDLWRDDSMPRAAEFVAAFTEFCRGLTPEPSLSTDKVFSIEDDKIWFSGFLDQYFAPLPVWILRKSGSSD